MPSKELIEKVASHFEFPDKKTTLVTAENILNEILAALQEDRYLHEIIERHFNMPHGIGYGKDRLSVLLAASALGEQSDG